MLSEYHWGPQLVALILPIRWVHFMVCHDIYIEKLRGIVRKNHHLSYKKSPNITISRTLQKAS